MTFHESILINIFLKTFSIRKFCRNFLLQLMVDVWNQNCLMILTLYVLNLSKILCVLLLTLLLKSWFKNSYDYIVFFVFIGWEIFWCWPQLNKTSFRHAIVRHWESFGDQTITDLGMSSYAWGNILMTWLELNNS